LTFPGGEPFAAGWALDTIATIAAITKPAARIGSHAKR
jgi:hypothetical protein